MPPLRRPAAMKRAVVLLVLTAIVHATAGTALLAEQPKSGGSAPAGRSEGNAGRAARIGVGHGTAGLPTPVLEMRDAILAAVASGRIEDLRVAIEMNEIKPAFTDGPVADPIAWLKAQSADGEGRDVLAAVGAILAAPHAIVPLGRDLENNRIYVWPHLAELGLQRLSAADEAELARLAPADAVTAMRAAGRYQGWRIAIAADGTWHLLAK